MEQALQYIEETKPEILISDSVMRDEIVYPGLVASKFGIPPTTLNLYTLKAAIRKKYPVPTKSQAAKARWEMMSDEEKEDFTRWRGDCRLTVKTSNKLGQTNAIVKQFLRSHPSRFKEETIEPATLITELGEPLARAARLAGVSNADLQLYVYVEARRLGYKISKPINPFSAAFL